MSRPARFALRVTVAAILLVAAIAVLEPGWLQSLRGSLPVTGRDAWTTSTSVHSQLLGKDMPIEVFAPPTTCANPELLVLFHGRGADERQWMEGSQGDGVGIDSIAHRLIDAQRIVPLTIVSARIDDSYGVDSAAADDGYDHGPYERYIIEELLPAIEPSYGTAARPSVTVGGLSMGGFAALNLAFDHPQEFGGVGALSPAFFVSPPADRTWIYAGDGRRPLLDRAREGAADGTPIFLGFGDADYSWIKEATTRLAGVLAERGQASEPVVVSGGHEIATWRQLAEPMLLRLFGGQDPLQGTC